MTRQTTARTPAQAGFTPAMNGVLQRKCACGTHTISGSVCDACRKNDESAFQRAPASPAHQSGVPPIVHDVLRSPGQPLDPVTRAFFEPRLDYDFSKVRVHADATAAASARAINALAYTVGNHLVFGKEQYSSNSAEGRGVLAHELTHAIQQGMSAPHLDSLALDLSDTSSGEREAERVRTAIKTSAEVGDISERARENIQRLEGSPAGGCGVCYGDPGSVGSAAHPIIERAFKEQYGERLQPEFPLAPSPTDENGRLDLAELTGPDQTNIGEIKPANPAGLLRGDMDLIWYEKKLKELGFSVGRLILPPPLRAIKFPTLAPPPCPPTQDLYVNPPVIGIYTYWCAPDFAELIGRCPCRTPPPPVPVKEKVTVKEQAREKGTEKAPRAVPEPEVLIPVLAATLFAWALKKAAGRVAAPATVLAAIVLLANGAEASIGFQGDDPLEALFKIAAQKGTPVPDDLKRAIKNDPTLRKLLEDAVRKGNPSEAERQLGAQFTRAIIENRKNMSEEEIQELLTLTKQNQSIIPGSSLTSEVLQRSLEEAKTRKAKGAGATIAEKEAPSAPESPTPQREEERPFAEPSGARPSAPATRLVDALVRSKGKGPKLDQASFKKIHEILGSMAPPLTDAEADALIAKVVSAEGKTIGEVLASVRESIASLRKSATEGEVTTGRQVEAKAEEAAEGEVTSSKEATSGRPAKIPAPLEKLPEEKAKMSKSDLEIGKIYARILSKGRFDFLTKGESVLLYDAKQLFISGRQFSGLMAARGEDGILCLGQISVTPKNKFSKNEWIMTIHSGSKLFGSNGSLYTITETTEVRVVPRK